MKNQINIERKEPEEKEPFLAKLPPEMVFLYFLLSSLSVLFFVLTLSYLISKGTWSWEQFSFPLAFVFSTLALLASSFTMHHTQLAYQAEDGDHLKKMLYATLGLTLIFTIGQILGWYDLYRMGIYFAGKPDGSYLYLLSGLHILHVLAGLIPLTWMVFFVNKALSNTADELLYFTSQKRAVQLKMLVIYWHFVDVIWLYLLVFFLFNHL